MSKLDKFNCIEKWKDIIINGDITNLDALIHENATFNSPIVYSPQIGKKIVVQYLSAAVKIFKNKNFKYTKILSNNNCTFAEFEAKFDTIVVNGIDLIIIKNNLIYEFKVFLRPLKGINVVWNEMKKSLRNIQ